MGDDILVNIQSPISLFSSLLRSPLRHDVIWHFAIACCCLLVASCCNCCKQQNTLRDCLHFILSLQYCSYVRLIIHNLQPQWLHHQQRRALRPNRVSPPKAHQQHLLPAESLAFGLLKRPWQVLRKRQGNQASSAKERKDSERYQGRLRRRRRW